MQFGFRGTFSIIFDFNFENTGDRKNNYKEL